MVRLFLLGGAIIVGLYYWLTRLRPLQIIAAPNPATSYDEALRRLEILQAGEGGEVNPVCRTALSTHGRSVERVVVLVHGFTSCPHQFSQLAEEFFAQGYNVLNVRLPHHGLADTLTPELAQLTAEEMVAQTNAALDIAQGLGDQVTLLGLSLGAVLAGWAAHHRRGVDRTVLVAPAFAICAIPVRQQRLFANLLRRLPNFFRWWDPERQAERMAPAHAYPRLASHGLSALLRLGAIVQAEARQSRPICPRIIVMINPRDEVVDNAATAATVAAWRSHGAHVTTHTFPADWALLHDLMDPAQPGQQVALVYPQLLAWLDG